MPNSIAALACSFPVEDDEVYPLVIEKIADSWLGGQDCINEFWLALNDDGEAAWLVDEVFAIVDGLQRKAAAEIPCVALYDSHPAYDLVDGFISGSELLRVDTGSVRCWNRSSSRLLRAQ